MMLFLRPQGQDYIPLTPEELTLLLEGLSKARADRSAVKTVQEKTTKLHRKNRTQHPLLPQKEASTLREQRKREAVAV